MTQAALRPLLFTPLKLRDVELANRIAVPPMAQYQARNGYPVEHHLVNYGKFAQGGAGLVFVEATAVLRDGRITNGCLGIWEDAQAEALRPIATFLKDQGSVPAIQIGHGGRKASMQRPWHGNGPLTLKAKLRPGEKLMLRVRRGRIAVNAMNDLDCSQLTIATPLVPSPNVTRNTVYVGPEMDPTLLVNVYKQEWIDQNINGAALARLSRDGADAIVDACIVADRGVRARLQTSLAYAWDAADPNASAQIVNLR